MRRAVAPLFVNFPCYSMGIFAFFPVFDYLAFYSLGIFVFFQLSIFHVVQKGLRFLSAGENVKNSIQQQKVLLNG